MFRRCSGAFRGVSGRFRVLQTPSHNMPLREFYKQRLAFGENFLRVINTITIILAFKICRIFVFGRYLFLEVRSFPRASTNKYRCTLSRQIRLPFI